jgi:hypothetical protein
MFSGYDDEGEIIAHARVAIASRAMVDTVCAPRRASQIIDLQNYV